MRSVINQTSRRLLTLAVLGSSVLTQTGCEKSDVVANQPEQGRWEVQYYHTLDAGLVDSTNASARMCNYKGDNVNNTVYLDIFGTANAAFFKNGSNNWLVRQDGRSVFFMGPVGYPAVNFPYAEATEQKSDTKLYRHYIPGSSPFGHQVVITAGNEKGVNLIPKTDFVVPSFDPVTGLTKLRMNHKRENRYIRIRTDYLSLDTSITDQNGRHPVVILTDLYQIDCGSSASDGVSSNQLTQATFTKVGQRINLSKSSRIEDGNFSNESERRLNQARGMAKSL